MIATNENTIRLAPRTIVYPYISVGGVDIAYVSIDFHGLTMTV